MKLLQKAARQMGQERTFKKGQIILHQGDILSHFYFITKGYVKVYNILETGDERLLLLLSKDEVFPVIINIGRGDYELKYFYEAVTDVKAVVAKQDDIADYVKNNYARLNAILDYIANANRLLMERLEVMESKSAKQKLTKILPYLVKKTGKKLGPKKFCLKLKLTHQDLANMTGLTRETASIQLKELENDGVISYRRGYLVINFAKLKDEWAHLQALSEQSLF